MGAHAYTAISSFIPLHLMATMANWAMLTRSTARSMTGFVAPFSTSNCSPAYGFPPAARWHQNSGYHEPRCFRRISNC